MTIIEKDILDGSDRAQIRELWNKEYPEVIFHKDQSDTDQYLHDIEHAMHTFLYNEENFLIAWFCEFIRDGEKYFVMIVNGLFRGKGIGSELLEKAKQKNEVLNGWIVLNEGYKLRNGKLYKSPKEFYQKNGFRVFPEIALTKHNLSTVKIQWRRKWHDN